MLILEMRKCAISAAAISFIVGSIPAQSQNFQTGRILVCANKIKTRTDGCVELPPPFDNLNRRMLPNKRIDFKLLIIGYRDALTYLHNYGHLPVKVAVWRDGLRKEDDIPIGLNQDDWETDGEKLVNQLAEDGQFTWRTFFHVNLNNAKSIRIEINDASNVIALSEGNPARLFFGLVN